MFGSEIPSQTFCIPASFFSHRRVIAGWLLAGETFTEVQIIGLVIILIGVLLTKLPEYKESKIFTRIGLLSNKNAG